ncbi:MAG: hypothetical protein SVG88_05810 [Halobacteriales archaeon]|nr:hypothetical protein [Halobacteriales archaeon]
MLDDLSQLGFKGWVLTVLGVIALLLFLLILFYPGPLALNDRVPFALIFGIPGLMSLVHVKYEYLER